MSEENTERIIEDEQLVIHGELTQLSGIIDEVNVKIEELKATRKKMMTLKGVFEEVAESRKLDLKQVELDLEESLPNPD
tara:strand:- start:6660 stop:6896 length:237 start_codon:yes stop_codon:yes gene_type:complete